MSEHGGNEEGSNACTHFHFSNPVRVCNMNLERSESRRLVWNWFKIGWRPVLRTVPIPVETILVGVEGIFHHWNPKASVDAMNIL